MKIIILSPSNNVVGGVERFSQYLKKIFIEDGHEVKIIYPIPDKITKLFSLIGLHAPYLGLRLGQIAKKEGFDILVTNGLLGWNLKNKKIINVQHGTFVASAERIDKGRNWMKWFIKKYIWGYFEMLAAQRASQVVAVSKETARFVSSFYRISNVRVVYNTIDFDLFKKQEKSSARKRFGFSESEKLLLFVGRFEYGKGSDVLISLMAKLNKNDWKLILASDSAVEANSIVSLKNVPYSDLPFLYSACDFFVFPSRHEGASLALVEAMSCEVPFLATNVGSVPEIIEEDLAFKKFVFDLSNFAKKAEDVILQEEIDLAKGTKARELALKIFSYKQFKEGYLQILKELL